MSKHNVARTIGFTTFANIDVASTIGFITFPNVMFLDPLVLQHFQNKCCLRNWFYNNLKQMLLEQLVLDHLQKE